MVLWPEKMVKVNVFAVKGTEYALLKFLHKEGVLHFEKGSEKGAFKKGAPLPALDAISKPLVYFKGIMDIVCPFCALNPLDVHDELPSLREVLSAASSLEPRAKHFEELYKQKENLVSHISTLTERIDVYGKMVSAGLSYNKLSKSLKGFFIDMDIDSTLFENKPIEKFVKAEDGAVILVRVENAGEIETILRDENLPYEALPEENPKKLLSKYKDELADANNKLEKVKKELKALCAELSELPKVVNSLKVYEEEATVASNSLESDHLILIEGWLPKKHFEAFKKKLANEFGKRVYVQPVMEKEPEEHAHEKSEDMPPTYIENPDAIKPYELAFGFSSLPRGDDLNPALWYALTFPFIYGMIIGDVGYSIISLIIAYLLKKAKPYSEAVQNLANVWIIASVGGIVWGVIFDEWMGASHAFWLNALFGVNNAFYHGFHRVELFTLLLGLTGLVGGIHLLLGNLLGAYAAYVHGHKKHMVAKTGWFFLILGFLMWVGSYLNVWQLSLPGIILMAVSAIIIGVYEGIMGLVELPSVVSNIASYFRIAAVGVAGVILAELINKMLFPSFSGGLVGLLTGLIMAVVFLALHAANAFIAMFESTVQGGRLHILEFALKFIRGGGKPYRPFSLPSFMLKKRGEKYGN